MTTNQKARNQENCSYPTTRRLKKYLEVIEFPISEPMSIG